jgi:serine/threonine protein kinase/tetratricopeptide (TPR) repeat protein
VKKDKSLQVADELVGTVVAERYRLDSVLGIGGTGVVFRATCLEDGSTVSVKTMRQDLTTERAIARFFRGARLSAGLDHPGLVQTLAYGQSKGAGSIPFQVMQFVDGLSLMDLTTTGLAPAQIIGLGCRMLDALGYVHARGVLHRDIKPANILLERMPDGTLAPRITDFGIAAAFLGDLQSQGITGGNTLIGTPEYMAPEQAQAGAMNGPELDLYAVGVVLYELLSGRLPFEGKGTSVLAAKATIDAPPLEVEGLDPSIRLEIGRLIAREPRRRYAMAAQARDALQPHAEPWVVGADWMEALREPSRRVTPRFMRRRRQQQPPGEQTLQQHWPTLVVPRATPRNRDVLPGRDGVIRSIERCAQEVETDQMRVVSLVGEAGMGKTAVLDHIAALLVQQGRFLVVRAPYFKGGAHAGGVRWGLERTLGVQGLDRKDVAYAVRKLLARYDDVDEEEVAQLVACLRPSDDQPAELLTARLGEQMALIVRLLRRLARTRPVLLLIDDADNASSDLHHFLEFVSLEALFDPWSLLILCGVGISDATQPISAQAIRLSTNDDRTYRSMRLHPIPNELLVHDLIQQHNITQVHAHKIAKRAGGNPLHANYLAQIGISALSLTVSTGDGGRPGSQASIPGELMRLMVLRLRRLLAHAEDAEGARAILEGLAVLGEAVDEDLLKAVMAPEQQGRFAVDLDGLLELGMVEIFDHAEPFVLGFTPALLRDAVLAHLTPDRLEELHRRSLEVRLGLEPARRSGHWGLIGDHYAAIGDLAEAYKCWLKGMRYEISVGNLMRGVNWGRRALSQLPKTDPVWAHTAMLGAALMFDAGEAEEAESLLRDVMDIADVDQALQAGDLLCDILENLGESDEWAELVEEISLRESEAGPVGLCALYCARAMWRNTHGQSEEALVDAQLALDLAEPGPPAQRAAQRLAFACLPRMRLDDALKAAHRSLAEAGEVPLLRARSLRTVGTVQIWHGKAEAAIETLKEASSLCRRSGILTRYPISLHDLGDAYRVAGQYSEARTQYSEAIRLCEGLPLASTAALCRFQQGMCDIAQGRTTAFLSNIDDLVSDGLRVGLGMSAPFGELLRCWACAVAGDVPTALNSFAKIGPLEAVSIDPQVPEVLIDLSERLVKAVLAGGLGLELLAQIRRVCNATRDMFGDAGDVARLHRADLLLRQLPIAPA